MPSYQERPNDRKSSDTVPSASPGPENKHGPVGRDWFPMHHAGKVNGNNRAICSREVKHLLSINRTDIIGTHAPS